MEHNQPHQTSIDSFSRRDFLKAGSFLSLTTFFKESHGAPNKENDSLSPQSLI